MMPVACADRSRIARTESLLAARVSVVEVMPWPYDDPPRSYPTVSGRAAASTMAPSESRAALRPSARQAASVTTVSTTGLNSVEAYLAASAAARPSPAAHSSTYRSAESASMARRPSQVASASSISAIAS